MNTQQSSNNYVATKKELYQKYWKVPERRKKNVMNSIIAKCRNISLESAKPKQKIDPKEYRLFVEEVGEI